MKGKFWSAWPLAHLKGGTFPKDGRLLKILYSWITMPGTGVIINNASSNVKSVIGFCLQKDIPEAFRLSEALNDRALSKLSTTCCSMPWGLYLIKCNPIHPMKFMTMTAKRISTGNSTNFYPDKFDRPFIRGKKPNKLSARHLRCPRISWLFKRFCYK